MMQWPLRFACTPSLPLPQGWDRGQESPARPPPRLIITGTRGFELSSAVYTHSQLVKQGVDATCTYFKACSMGSSTIPMFLNHATAST
jgi:hypothetical protein